MNPLPDFKRSTQPILMDGALGTELERRGAPIERVGWSALAVLEQEDLIRVIHRDYLSAGARMHIVNSFALGRHVLESVGLGARCTELNLRAVALFEEALANSDVARSSVWVAGSLSTFAADSDRSLLPSADQLRRNTTEQASALVSAGVDLLTLEMLFDVEVSATMIESVTPFDLPVIIGFTCNWQEQAGGPITIGAGSGTPTHLFESALTEVLSRSLPNQTILSIMHSDLDVTDAALAIVRRHWDGPIALYPNSGSFEDLHLQFDSVCHPESFAVAAMRWADQGIAIIGGCCGIGPNHICELSARLSTDSSA